MPLGNLDGPVKEAISFTQTIKDVNRYKRMSPLKQLKEIMPIFEMLNKSCTFMIYPELTLNGVIHLHGILEIEDKVEWYKRTLRMLNSYGFNKIDKIKDYNKWYDYCIKERDIMAKLFCNLPICNDNYRDIYNWKKTSKIVKFFPEDKSVV